jgi:hypothetical protein
MSKVTAVELDVKDATSLVVSAIEGGINYWGECKGYKWTKWYTDGGESMKDEFLRDIPRDEVLVWIREDEENPEFEEPQNDGNPWFGVTIENLEKALCVALTKYGHLYHFRGQEIDTDATGAEVVFQIALFGEVVFG